MLTEEEVIANFNPNESIGFSDEDNAKLHQRLHWYKAEKGRTDRVAVVYFPTILESARRQILRGNQNATIEEQKTALAKVKRTLAEKLGKSATSLTPGELLDTREVRLKQCRAVYNKDLGFLEIPEDLSRSEQAIWDKLGEARSYFYTLLLIYQGDRDGEVEREHASRGWRIVPWRFSEEKYDTFRKIDKGLHEDSSSIANADLLLTCTDSQFQKITITNAGSAFYKQNTDFLGRVLEAAASLRDRLQPFRQLSTEELREKLGMPATAVTPSSAADGFDFSEVLATV